MHVTFDNAALDDGAFPVQEICDYYRDFGKLPTTSGCTPEDFDRMFDAIHAAHPDSKILYLAYSAVTTCSYQSALISAEHRDYVTAIDTRQVSIGQPRWWSRWQSVCGPPRTCPLPRRWTWPWK